MLNFGMLPPEVISTMMYSGPGSGPMMGAAAGWDALTSQLDSFALGYSSVISELQDEVWSGAASEAMVAAATPYVAWATTTATLTEQAASQARAAAAAYETAFAATVPPAVVTANRVQLATLVATNFFGQNTPMIAATEAAYAQMWAQDAAAMYGYATAASAATQLTPFQEPPRTTYAATQSAQSAAPAQAAGTSVAAEIAGHSHASMSQLMSTVPQQLNALSTAESSGPFASLSSSMISGVDAFNTLIRPVILAMQSWRTFGNIASFTLALNNTSSAPVAAVPSAAAAGEFGPGAAGARGAVLVRMGEAAPVGKLSVPASWPATTPAVDAAIPPPQLAATQHREFSPRVARPAMNGRTTVPPAGFGPMQGIAPRRTGTPVFRMRDRRYRMPRPAVGG